MRRRWRTCAGLGSIGMRGRCISRRGFRNIARRLRSWWRGSWLTRACVRGREAEDCDLPRMRGADASRLAKRHGETRLSSYRKAAVPAGRIVSMLAKWSGIDVNDDVAPRDLVGRFDLAKLPRDAIIFKAE